MPFWRCPYCGTPQAESSRCWVCRRSTTSCATCRHYRRGVAGGLGLCGLDHRRSALRGDEIRSCWLAATPAPPVIEVAAVATWSPESRAGTAPGDPSARQPRTFVPVEELDPASATETGRATAVATPAAPVTQPADARPSAPTPPPAVADSPAPAHGWSLWGELEA